MKLSRICLLIVSVALLAATVLAQSREPEPALADERIAPPATMAGRGEPLVFLSELGHESTLSAGVGFSGVYTDNTFLVATPRENDMSYEFNPHLSWQQFTSRMNLDLSLAAGFVANQRFTQRNQSSQNFAVDFTYRLRPYVNLRLSNAFVNTMGLFSGPAIATIPSSIGVVQQPTSTVLTPAAHIITNSTLAELNYQFSARSIIGARAVYALLRYPDAAPSVGNVPLFEGQSYSAEVFYNTQLSMRHWLGVTLRAQRFDAHSSLVTTNAQSILLLYSFKPLQNVSLSLFAGPQLTTLHVDHTLVTTIPAFEPRRWSPAAGATLGWQGHHTSATVSYTRQVNDGGGLASAVVGDAVQAGVRRQLGTRQQISASFTYGSNETLIPGINLRSYSSRVDFSRRLTRSVVGGVGYGFDQQKAASTQAAAQANRIWFSLGYDFTRPLGK